MSTTEKEINDFLDNHFNKGLQGYFYDNEKAERTIVDNSSISFSIKEDSKGCGKRYSVEITVDATASTDLPGQLLRNRSRIESNLLTAIRKLIAAEKELWKDFLIGKVTVIVQ